MRTATLLLMAAAVWADDAEIRVELDRDGVRRAARLDETFRRGDRIRLRVRTDFDARLEALLESGTGPVLLYPGIGESNGIRAGREHWIPALVFDDTPGIERVVLLLSREPGGGEMDRAIESRPAWKARGRGLLASARAEPPPEVRELPDGVAVRSSFHRPAPVTLAFKHGKKP